MSVKKKFYLTLLSAGAILIAAGAGVALYLFLNITEASSDYVESQKELLTLQKKGVLIKEFERELESIQSDWPKMKRYFCGKKTFWDLLKHWKSLPKKRKIVIVSILSERLRPKPRPARQKPMKRHPFLFSE